MKLKILIIALMLSNTALYAGQAGKGGYFHQTETVSRYVEIVKHFLAAHISGIEPLDFESLRKNSTEKPVDQSQLAKIINNC